MKKSTPARSKKLDNGISLPRSGMDIGGKTASTIAAGPTNAQQAESGARLEMSRLTANIKATGKVDITARALARLQAKFGDHQALTRFNAAFQGAKKPPLLRNRGSVQ
jgi:hypothetical protein